MTLVMSCHGAYDYSLQASQLGMAAFCYSSLTLCSLPNDLQHNERFSSRGFFQASSCSVPPSLVSEEGSVFRKTVDFTFQMWEARKDSSNTQ